MLYLAIESSCDETAVAVVSSPRGKDEFTVLSNEIASQIDIHKRFGGVVPEIASRAHIEAISPLTYKALSDAGVAMADIDCVAVTTEPGLIGALLVGVNFAKSLAFSNGKPLIGVNHIEGHVSANFLTHAELEPPFLCLVVSGGHSHLVEVSGYGCYRLLGQTRDDAAGEAFDKAARVLGLPYPGGPRIDRLAEEGNPEAFQLPRPRTEKPYDYSFSGLKTAFMNLAHQMEQRGEPLPKADLAASFRNAVCTELAEKAERLLLDERARGRRLPMALAGGVSANRELRRRFEALCGRLQVPLYMPRLELCTDNGAMIGSAAYYRLRRGETAGLALNAAPALRLVEPSAPADEEGERP